MRPFICLGAALPLLMLVCSEAGARSRGSSPYYERQIETDRPAHGYSGWVWGGGSRSLYCDYQRLPNRVCAVDRSGRERCRVKSWTLKQYCY